MCGDLKAHKKQGIVIAPVCLDCAPRYDDVPPGYKRCSQCLKVRKLECFCKTRSRKHPHCKDCRAAYASRIDPERRRAQNLWSNYRLTLAQYDSLLAEQRGLCAICQQPEMLIDPYTKEVKALAVDHDHATGQVRALLCQSCNAALGFIEPYPPRAIALIAYLEKQQKAV